ncbi:hypothetical protein ACFV4F_10020 [Kitasatospora sp. NPDC059722]|uniref:hypothetical protein n=1 Tax=unclassified Kitasatospora TaxID=2633591 RepID=UPI00369EEEB3
MSDGVELRGTLRKVEDVEFEVVRVTIDVADDAVRRELEKDPAGTVRRFLESQGFKVNAITAPEPQPGLPYHPGYIHITSGGDESKWSPVFPLADGDAVSAGAERVRVGTAELFEVTIELDDAARRAVAADPAGAFRRFFESRGQVVNGVTPGPPGVSGPLGGGFWAHENSGPERSQWYHIFP